MKLLYCPDCGDIFNLTKESKSCHCGKVTGNYIDNLNAIYTDGIPLGFVNASFGLAVFDRPKSGRGKDFTAFVIPYNCPTFKKQ